MWTAVIFLFISLHMLSLNLGESVTGLQPGLIVRENRFEIVRRQFRQENIWGKKRVQRLRKLQSAYAMSRPSF
jgi:hypothetical protein